jgi:hypothetical protein
LFLRPISRLIPIQFWEGEISVGWRLLLFDKL